MPEALVFRCLEYLKQPLILFLELLRDLAVLGLERAQVVARSDFEVCDLLHAPLSLLEELPQVVLEHLDVVRLVLLYDALHADASAAVQAVGLTLVAWVERAHRVETPTKLDDWILTLKLYSH